MSRLNESRRELEERLSDVREALDREVGFLPRSASWVVPIIAFSVGLWGARAFYLRRRRRSPAEDGN